MKFRLGKIDEYIVDCPQFFAFEGGREDRNPQRKGLGQRSTTAANLFWVGNWVHIHLKPTSMCGIQLGGGGGGGGVKATPPSQLPLKAKRPREEKGKSKVQLSLRYSCKHDNYCEDFEWEREREREC